MQDLIDKIYLVMGIGEDTLPLNIVTYYLTEWQTVYPNSDCLAVYNTIVSCYEWLIRQSAALDASEGVVKSEKEANIEIEMFERKAGDNTAVWQTALDMFEKNPSLSLPSCKNELRNSNSGLVIIGGVDPAKVAGLSHRSSKPYNWKSNYPRGGYLN